ncbi:uncharacterized protein F5147DRAFT_808667 [Suillus discolor]|uniref:Uncharacterized protein n=1 Tax=Suillus discolor TaxID=1912936 RepID=A0A9P7F2H0_9AGAM|nr:uncharacterized protein F5147DRAFT_808667 [Suillus discolor]KAG2103700.1 hypothetical protein F5147DRAFT_808667 [Suillus discolor]
MTRVEGREIISNLSKAAGLAHMISTMCPDIDHADEYVRNTTAHVFSVIASALDIPSLLPFLKAASVTPTPAPALLDSRRGGMLPALRKTVVWTAVTPPLA